MSADELNVREVARLLGVHENTIRNWAKAGVIRPSRVLPTGYKRFSREDECHRLTTERDGLRAEVTELRNALRQIANTYAAPEAVVRFAEAFTAKPDLTRWERRQLTP